jgi:hypothetical protein
VVTPLTDSTELLFSFDQHARASPPDARRRSASLGALPRRLVDQTARRAFRCAMAARTSSTRSVMWWSPGPRLVDVLSRIRRLRRRGFRANSSFDSPTGTKCARTCCDATSSGRLDLEAKARRDRTRARPPDP